MAIEIPLSQGKVALVDESDFPEIAQFKWNAHHERGRWYAWRYAPVKGKQVYVKMHRQILCPPVGLDIDHKNGNGLDNRRSNLRLATRSQNNANRVKASGSSIFKGVHWSSRRKHWIAQIKINHRPIYIGSFSNERDAARAYDKGAFEIAGEFARLNFPKEKYNANANAS